MLGLGDYDSDEEEEVKDAPTTQAKVEDVQKAKIPEQLIPEPVRPKEKQIESNGPKEDITIRDEDTPEDSRIEDGDTPVGRDGRSMSPFSANAIAIQNLTMPPVPNFDIPPSPPGSPPQAATKKFAQFLELKKKGVHFNQKLANNPALKNPSLLGKQMQFAGIEHDDQYAHALPDGILPLKFPKLAYWEELNRTQESLRKKKEAQPREAVEFVPASTSSNSSRGGPARGSAAERIMAGLDRDSSGSPAVSDSGRQRELERRGGRFDQKPRYRSRSRSPKRRRH